MPLIDSLTEPNEENGPRKHSYQSRRDFVNRLTLTKDDLNVFFSAKNEAEVYLPKEATDRLQEIWKEWVSINTDIRSRHRALDEQAADAPELYEKVYGKQRRDFRQELEKQIKDILKPLAHLQS